jgi:hypothetical protein
MNWSNGISFPTLPPTEAVTLATLEASQPPPVEEDAWYDRVELGSWEEDISSSWELYSNVPRPRVPIEHLIHIRSVHGQGRDRYVRLENAEGKLIEVDYGCVDLFFPDLLEAYFESESLNPHDGYD